MCGKVIIAEDKIGHGFNRFAQGGQGILMRPIMKIDFISYYGLLRNWGKRSTSYSSKILIVDKVITGQMSAHVSNFIVPAIFEFVGNPNLENLSSAFV